MATGNKTLEDLLNPISEQLGHSSIADNVELPVWQHTPWRVTDGMDKSQLVELFASEAEKIHVQVSRCTRAGLAECLAGIVGQGEPDGGQACSVVCAADDRFDPQVYEAVSGQELVSQLTVWDAAQEQASIDAALNATYGITYAAAGIAETGTVVQPCGPQCGRAVSLLPLVHVAVVDAASIEPTMGEVLQAYGEQGAALPSQLCFISGPSATADIELVRVEGVHGPMYVHYVVVA